MFWRPYSIRAAHRKQMTQARPTSRATIEDDDGHGTHADANKDHHHIACAYSSAQRGIAQASDSRCHVLFMVRSVQRYDAHAPSHASVAVRAAHPMHALRRVYSDACGGECSARGKDRCLRYLMSETDIDHLPFRFHPKSPSLRERAAPRVRAALCGRARRIYQAQKTRCEEHVVRGVACGEQ